MVETDIRIVSYGDRLFLDVRRVQTRTTDNASDLLQKACRLLRLRHSLAAIPFRPNSQLELLVAAPRPLGVLVLEGDDWQMELHDIGPTRLHFTKPGDAPLMAGLVERYLLVQLARRTNMWTLDSPRIWYEAEPFRTEDGINAVRRFHISVVAVGNEGLGVVTHVSTAFFTVDTIADFYDPSLQPAEREQRQRHFEKLSLRQRGQKGTLLYDLGHSRHKCYFDEFLPGVTCATTDLLRIDGVTYASLYDYYTRNRPYAKIGADDPVARVSFPKLDRPQSVAANRLRLRVMNKALPEPLKQIDKIPPGERARLVDCFWSAVGEDLLGKGLKPGLWRPRETKIVHLKLPVLLFGQGKPLPPPAESTTDAYRTHFRGRLSTLNGAGCYNIPPTMERRIVVAYPRRLDSTMVDEFADELVNRLNRWTRKQLSAETLPYTTVPEAITELNSRVTGMVVFVFEDIEPATYYLLSAELKNWRIKRVTAAELLSRFRQQSFVDMNALDVLQQLDCVPWTLALPLNYQAQLAIDVGVDRRYFALSLLVCRPEHYQTPFWIDTRLWPKPDHRRETIEYEILRDKMVELCRPLPQRRFDPIESLLVLRDGRESGDEMESVRAAQTELTRLGILASNAQVDIVDFHKHSLKGIRLWERNNADVTNVLEGTILLLDNRTVVLANTGAATLHQGTADPLVLVATHDGVDMLTVASDVFATAQLNWSSPGVARRLPVPIRRTDQELETRRAQEIRGLR